MKNFINIVTIFIVVLLQLTLVSRLEIYNSLINLPMIILVTLILIKRTDLSIWWVMSGLLLDIFSPLTFGLYTFTFIAVYYFANAVMKRIFYDLNLYIVALFFAGSSVIIDIPFLFINFNSQILVGNIIYNTLAGCLIYWLVKYYLEPQSIIKVEL